MPTIFDRELKEFESLAERIPGEALDRVREIVRGHSYFVPLDGYHSLLKLIDVTCKGAYVFLMSGNDTTGENGEVVLSINRILCDHKIELPNSSERKVLHLINRPQFTALPESDKPVLLTTKFNLTNIPTPSNNFVDREGNVFSAHAVDAKISVISWDLDGSKASRAPFSWICMFEGAWNLPPFG